MVKKQKQNFADRDLALDLLREIMVVLPLFKEVRIKIKNHRPQAPHPHHRLQVHLRAGEAVTATAAVVAVQAVAAVKNRS